MINYVKQIISSLPKILIDSIKVAFATLGGVGIVVSFTSFSLDSVGKLPAQIGVVVLAYLILVIGTGLSILSQPITKSIKAILRIVFDMFLMKTFYFCKNKEIFHETIDFYY